MTEGTPVLHGEVVGYRVWTINEDLGLQSIVCNTQWPIGNHVSARCISPVSSFGFNLTPHYSEAHDSPHVKCGCGIYAYHDFLHTAEYKAWRGEIRVRGVIVAWGNIEVHNIGFRAEHARVAALVSEGTRLNRLIIEAVAQRYSIPRINAEDVEFLTAEYGAPIPEDLRPEPEPPKEPWDVSLYIFGRPGLVSSRYIARSVLTQAFVADDFIGRKINEFIRRQRQQPLIVNRPSSPIQRLIEKKNAQKYDPRAYVPKRKGGKR